MSHSLAPRCVRCACVCALQALTQPPPALATCARRLPAASRCCCCSASATRACCSSRRRSTATRSRRPQPRTRFRFSRCSSFPDFACCRCTWTAARRGASARVRPNTPRRRNRSALAALLTKQRHRLRLLPKRRRRTRLLRMRRMARAAARRQPRRSSKETWSLCRLMRERRKANVYYSTSFPDSTRSAQSARGSTRDQRASCRSKRQQRPRRRIGGRRARCLRHGCCQHRHVSPQRLLRARQRSNVARYSALSHGNGVSARHALKRRPQSAPHQAHGATAAALVAAAARSMPWRARAPPAKPAYPPKTMRQVRTATTAGVAAATQASAAVQRWRCVARCRMQRMRSCHAPKASAAAAARPALQNRRRCPPTMTPPPPPRRPCAATGAPWRQVGPPAGAVGPID